MRKRIFSIMITIFLVFCSVFTTFAADAASDQPDIETMIVSADSTIIEDTEELESLEALEVVEALDNNEALEAEMTVTEAEEPAPFPSDSEPDEEEITIAMEDERDIENGFVGSLDKYILEVVWQDGYVQMIELGTGLTESGLQAKAKEILKTMGLPDANYDLCVQSGRTQAVIKNRAFYAGDDEVRVLAHMGYYMTATRNTLPAYRIARALGYHYVGGDVRFTKDNVAVVVHDATINATARNSDGSRISDPIYVRQHTYKELLQYDFGLSTNPVWKGEKIPTLEEYMTLSKKLGLIPNIHIKTDSGLTDDNFRSVAEIVMRTGMQGVATYAANDVRYLRPIIKIDPVSIVDMVITDKWDPHYVTDALSLKTGMNQVQIGIIKSLYHHNIAATCRYNGILLTTSANSEEEAAGIDAHVSMIATDGALPDAIIKGARRRAFHGGYYLSGDPSPGKDYQILAHANIGVMMRMLASMPHTPIRLDTNPDSTEIVRFRFIGLSNGYYNILCSRNAFSVGVKSAATWDGAPIALTNHNKAFQAQMWQIIHNDDGSVSFINKWSGKALQCAGGNEKKGTYFTQGAFDGRSSQRFWIRVSPCQTTIKYEGSKVRMQLPSSSIAVGTASATSGANVLALKYAENDNQKYRLLYSGDGYYRIVNVDSGLCLTKTGQGSTGNIAALAWNNQDNQRFRLVWNGSGPGMYYGTYRILCKQGNAAITINGSVNPSQNITVDWWTGRIGQQWRVTYAK